MTRRDHRQAAAGPDAADMVDDRNVRGGLPSIHVFHEQRLKGGPSAVVLRRQTWGRWVVDGGPVPGTLVDALTAGGEDVAGVLADAGACRDGDDRAAVAAEAGERHAHYATAIRQHPDAPVHDWYAI